jgi:hypothetical protein
MAKILLLNFSESEAVILSKSGYSADRGFMGSDRKEQGERIPFYAPHPLYEYDILLYNSDHSPTFANEFVGVQNLLSVEGCLDALHNHNSPPHLRISFVADPIGLPLLLQGGLDFVRLSPAEQNVSMFLEHKRPAEAFAVPEVQRLVASLKNNIARVGQFFGCTEPSDLWHFPVLLTRNHHEVAAYGASTSKDGPVPRYLVLPQMKNNAETAVEILQTLESLLPTLFPESSKNLWLQRDKFKLPDEKAKDDEIERKIAEATAAIEKLHQERELLVLENDFIRQLLVATEDGKLEPERRLSAVVKKALEFLEFRVEDIDQKTRTAIRKEDFGVSDGDFFAITEVTGTVNTNPKVKEYHDILGRMKTIFQRKTDILPAEVTQVSGLLVLNFDCQRPPSNRAKAYTGEFEHIIGSAVEHEIGILSTVELHKIVVAVKNGVLSKEEARSCLKKFGRIVYE